jgi:cell division inhibitor SepF
MSEIATVQPTSYSEAKDIAATYREGIPVIINMGELSELDARRLLDYLLGLRDGLNGQLKRVTQKVYLLSPSHVNIDDEDEDLNDAPAGDDLIISPIR